MMGKVQVSSTDVITEGNCLIFMDQGRELMYLGPIKGSPQIDGSNVLLNPVDFEKLKNVTPPGKAN